MGLSAEQIVMIRLILTGGPKAAEELMAVAGAQNKLATANLNAARTGAMFTRQSMLQTQALYTARRFLFYGTLATVGLIAVTAKLGFGYLSAMQQARVALEPVVGKGGALDLMMTKLFALSATTPFLFKDVAMSFRQLFQSFRFLGVSSDYTFKTLKTLTDALAGGGKLTEQALNRASAQLQHMAYLGRPTGRVLLNLANDSIPIWAALHKELGLTHDQMTNIARTGVTSIQVIDALNKFVESTPGFKGQALLAQTKTLHGAWTTFRDFLSQSVGNREGGLFSSLTRAFSNVDQMMFGNAARGRPTTITEIATALDKQLTPKTHIIINLFMFLEGVLQGLAGSFKLLAFSINLVLWPFNQLFGLFGSNRFAAHLLGIAVGVLIAAFLVQKTAMFIATEAQILYNLFTKEGAVTTGVMTVASWLYTTALYILSTAQGVFAERMIFSRTVSWLYIAALYVASAASWLWTTATFAAATAIDVLNTSLVYVGYTLTGLMANPITWIVAAVAVLVIGLVVLYYKWKPFHDLVNKTFKYIMQNAPYVAAALVIAFGPLGALAASLLLIIKYHRQIASWGHEAKAASKKSPTIFGINPFNIGHPIRDMQQIFGFASGGMVPITVGERGPENLYVPSGSVIQPTPTTSSPIKFPSNNGTNNRPIVVEVVMDRKVVARAVAHANLDKEAGL